MITSAYVCSACGNTEVKEREILCWVCGKGEMLFHEHLPVTYIPPMWVYDRVIVRQKDTGEDFVLRRIRLKGCARESTVEVVPLALCERWAPDAWAMNACPISIERLLVEYEATGRRQSLMRAPL